METQERNRISLTFGVESDRTALRIFVDAVVRALSTNFGGLKRMKHSGAWRSDGNDPEPPYRGELSFEVCETIEFVTDQPVERALDVAKSQIRHAEDQTADSSQTPEWVNVEIERVRVAHFDASAPVGGHYGETEEPDPVEKHRPPAPADRIGYNGAAYSTA